MVKKASTRRARKLQTLSRGPTSFTHAAFDLHQLGAGVGGHLFFAHTRPEPDDSNEVTGVWTATLPSSAVYRIEAFVPDIAAASGHAAYQIDTGGSTGTQTLFGSARSRHAHLSRTINQASHTNEWVDLGYHLIQGQGSTATMKVTLRTVTGTDDSTQGAEIAFDALAFVPVPAGQYVALLPPERGRLRPTRSRSGGERPQPVTVTATLAPRRARTQCLSAADDRCRPLLAKVTVGSTGTALIGTARTGLGAPENRLHQPAARGS